jgi:hypothetical protein
MMMMTTMTIIIMCADVNDFPWSTSQKGPTSQAYFDHSVNPTTDSNPAPRTELALPIEPKGQSRVLLDCLCRGTVYKLFTGIVKLHDIVLDDDNDNNKI